MADQLKIRINVEDGIAVVSARSRVLAVAAAAGSQVLAGAAAASHTPGHEENVTNPIVYPEEDTNPIVYPEFWMGVIAGTIVGVIGAKVYEKSRGKKKKDE